MTLGKTSGGFVGGFCRWWYIPIENISSFPAVDPLTQMLVSEPVLNGLSSWYGPVDVPDYQLGWEEDSQSSKAGTSYKQKVSGIITGLDADTHINLQNMAYHQFCVVGKARSDGNYYIIGNTEAGLDLSISSSTGLGAENAAGTKFTLAGESVDRALILKAFLGANSQLPSNNSTNPPVIIPVSAGVDQLRYVATGGEGASVTFNALAGKTILLFFRESTLLDVTTSGPDARQVQITGDTQFNFAADLTPGEIIKILFKY